MDENILKFIPDCSDDDETLAEIEEDRIHTLQNALESFGEKLTQSFKPGSFGHHEAVDRIHIFLTNWNDFVLEHPTIAINPEAFLKAALISKLAEDLHQLIALADKQNTRYKIDIPKEVYDRLEEIKNAKKGK